MLNKFELSNGEGSSDGESGLPRQTMKKGITVRVVILTFWVLGILAPVYSFSRVTPSSRTAFDRMFKTQASHVLVHMFLYAVLAYLLASLFFRAILSAKTFFVFVLMTVAVVAVSQEAIQMISEGVSLGLDEFFDFSVDLGGGLIGAGLYFGLHRDQRKINGGER